MRWILSALLFAALPAWADDTPAWFADTFLDVREDVADAAKQGKRLMLYFGQEGCPYCAQLMTINFRQPQIVERMQKRFVAVELNLWGDREVTTPDGRRMSEKQFAALMKVQFTPTLLFFDEKGAIALRLNGYYPPHQFEAALDYVSGRLEKKTPFADYMKTAVKAPASGSLHEEAFFSATRDLRRKPGAKPLAVLFETPACAACDELHQLGFTKPAVLAEAGKLEVARFSLSDAAPLVSASGKRTTPAALARELAISYVPSIVFFDARGGEVFRIEAYVRAFHLAGAFDYVSSRAYLREPSFQRFLQARQERLRAGGSAVDLWN